ncbi:histone lysine demethylase PHF8-like [Planoprotostelium fungivorum]|uniref:Ribosomal protein n=1 Tax=Planoprotostelium fungivorum TaxID=1890364 RepID=A0A2P6N779_9EUKA|nr:histone lysine demethylase PHF8-like [Planoprotostelium fungivorum]
MKYRAALKELCKFCQMITRNKRLTVQCTVNPKHKQRQIGRPVNLNFTLLLYSNGLGQDGLFQCLTVLHLGSNGTGLKFTIRIKPPVAPEPTETISIISNVASNPQPTAVATIIPPVGIPQISPEATCYCGSAHEWGFMIFCDKCERWYHGSCVDIPFEEDAADIDEYHCPDCARVHGESKLKSSRRSERKRKVHNYSVLDDGELSEKKKVKPAIDFVAFMKQKPGSISTENIVQKVKGVELTRELFTENGFRVPIVTTDDVPVGMKLPPSDFTVDDVRDTIGPGRLLDVIEVSTQSEVMPQWNLERWATYYRQINRKEIYNVISLEFSGTPLQEKVVAPQVVRDIDWIDNVWPSGRRGDTDKWPKVQRYCLMSVGGSYTDFHVDFGGSSVWYHVLRGQKIFLFVPPTTENLKAYSDWSSSIDQSNVFFGDQVPNCYYYLLEEGHTLMIPSGWIHAVYTPVDSLVFGGNFLHSFCVGTQLNVYKIEEDTQVPEKFQFPCFEEMCWYALDHLLNKLSGDHAPLSSWECEGYAKLIQTLEVWMKNQSKTKTDPEAKRKTLDECSRLLSSEVPTRSESVTENPWEQILLQNREASRLLPDIVTVLEESEKRRRAARIRRVPTDEEDFFEKDAGELPLMDDDEEFSLQLEKSDNQPRKMKKRLRQKTAHKWSQQPSLDRWDNLVDIPTEPGVIAPSIVILPPKPSPVPKKPAAPKVATPSTKSLNSFPFQQRELKLETQSMNRREAIQGLALGRPLQLFLLVCFATYAAFYITRPTTNLWPSVTAESVAAVNTTDATRPTETEAIAVNEPPIVAISLWFGGKIPTYVPEFFRTISRNPNITLLVPAVVNTPGICDGQESRTYYRQNIKFVCMQDVEMKNLFADKMCKVWQCSEKETQEFHLTMSGFLRDPYAITELKVAYASVFEDLVSEWEPPRKTPFSHWFRIDMDTLVGDLNNLFPWSTLPQFDVIAFKTPEYKSFWFPGASTLYRLHPRVDRIWTNIWGLQTPLSFSQVFANKPDVDQCNSPYGASDEGALTKAILTSPDITWIQLSHFLFWFSYARFDNEDYHTDVRGGDKYNSLLMVPNSLRPDDTLKLHRGGPPSAAQFSPYRDIIQFHGRQRLTYQCPYVLGMNLNWIVPSGRICIENSQTLLPEPEDSVMVVYRNETRGPVWRASIRDPLSQRMTLKMQGREKTFRYKNIPVLHLFVTKKKAPFRRDPLKEDEALQIFADRIAITKFVP